MSRLAFALATHADDAQLRRRMAEDRMEGSMAISFRREPSYFAGCRLQGDQAQVIKCTDRDTGQIVGIGSRLVTTLHLNGRAQRVGYLADLRLQPAYRRGTALARGYRFLRSLHQADRLPFYLTLIFGGNRAALQSLVGARAGLPRYSSLGHMLTPALRLDLARPALAIEGVSFEHSSAATWPETLAWLRREATAKQFSPTFADADFAADGRFGGLSPSDFFVARGAGRVLGCLAAWDQSSARQTHIERYAQPLRALRPLLNAAALVSPLRPLPPPGGRVPYLYISCVAVEGNDVRLFRALLRFAYNQLRQSPWHYAIVGLHEHDPLAQALRDYRRIEAGGHLFIVHYPEDGDPLRGLDARTIAFEMALA